MNAALELEAKRHPDKEIGPAALLYYHVDDPVAETTGEVGEEELNRMLQEQLRMRGVVNADESVLEKLDGEIGSKSLVIPVGRKKDGSLSAGSSVMSEEELHLLSDYVNHKVRSLGKEILEGHKEVNPYEAGKKDACEYCAYKKVCGFDPALPGYQKRQLEDLKETEIMQRMKEELE